MINPLINGADLIDGLLMLGLVVVAVSAFIVSRKASEGWLDNWPEKH